MTKYFLPIKKGLTHLATSAVWLKEIIYTRIFMYSLRFFMLSMKIILMYKFVEQFPWLANFAHSLHY